MIRLVFPFCLEPINSQFLYHDVRNHQFPPIFPVGGVSQELSFLSASHKVLCLSSVPRVPHGSPECSWLPIWNSSERRWSGARNSDRLSAMHPRVADGKVPVLGLGTSCSEISIVSRRSWACRNLDRV